MEVLSQYSIEQFLGLIWLNNIARYFFIAGLTYLVFWKWGFEKFKSKFLYEDLPQKEDIKREIFFSILSTLIFLIPTIFAIFVKDLGWNKVYFKISDMGIAWYATSFILVFFIHDAYFYWTHRLMHHRKLYNLFHKVHHLSKNPTPLAAFSFHPLEAILESLIFMIIAILMPIHFSVLIIFTFFSLFMNVYGHLGFNLFSEKQLNSYPLRFFGHSTHHSWHHRFYKGNYGFYLQFWDRLMGTWRGELKK